MTTAPHSLPRDGFTLIEALVALAILAIASAGLIRATEAHIDLVGGLQARTVAQWVAENRLAELGLASGVPVDGRERTEMLGRTWDVRVAVEGSEDPDLAVVRVSVAAEGARAASATLTGFVDTGSSGGARS